VTVFAGYGCSAKYPPPANVLCLAFGRRQAPSSGNFLCVGLAMTTLFGGFDPAFYETYAAHYPLPENYRQQWTIANLYPLLIHLNLFGRSYLPNILHTIQDF